MRFLKTPSAVWIVLLLCLAIGCREKKAANNIDALNKADGVVGEKESDGAKPAPFLWVVISDGSATVHTNEVLYQMSYRIVQGEPGAYSLLLNTGKTRLLAPVKLRKSGTLQLNVKGVDVQEFRRPVITVVEKLSTTDRADPYFQRSGILIYTGGESLQKPLDFVRFGPKAKNPAGSAWVVLSNFSSQLLGQYSVNYKIVSGTPPTCYWVIETDEGVASDLVTLKQSGTLKARIFNDYGSRTSPRSFFSTSAPIPGIPMRKLSGTIPLNGDPTTATAPPAPKPKPGSPPRFVPAAIHLEAGSAARLTNGVFTSLDRNQDLAITEQDGVTAAAFIALFDRNGDHQLNNDEIVEQISLPRPPNFKPITAIQFSILDKNRDGEVTLADNPEDSKSVRRKILNSDKNSDGKLSWDEIDAASLFVIPSSGFTKADTNKDGLLTKDEFRMSPGVFRLYDIDSNGSLTEDEVSLKSEGVKYNK